MNHHYLRKIRVIGQERDHRLSFGVSKSNIILKYLWTVGCQHKASEEKSDKRKSWTSDYKSDVYLPSFRIPSIVGWRQVLWISSRIAGVATGAGA